MLTAKQQRFCDEYLVSLNSTSAAIKAGYSPKTAGVIGSENLKKPNIASYIKSRQVETSEKLECTKEIIIAELMKVGLSDVTNYVTIDEGGLIQAIPIDDMPENSTAALNSISEDRTIMQTKDESEDIILKSKINFKMHDKVKALDLLGKHLGLFNDKLEIKLPQPIMVKTPNGKAIFTLGVKDVNKKQ